MGSDNNVSGFSRWGKCAIELSAKRNDFETRANSQQAKRSEVDCRHERARPIVDSVLVTDRIERGRRRESTQLAAKPAGDEVESQNVPAAG